MKATNKQLLQLAVIELRRWELVAAQDDDKQYMVEILKVAINAMRGDCDDDNR